MDKLNMYTTDMASENFKKLSELFPNAVTETMDQDGNIIRAIDKDVLQQEISAFVVEGQQERYQFTWPDKKRKSIVMANIPTSDTLRLQRERSVGKDGTSGKADSQNIYIEGDNLDALKLLHETYQGKIKTIYIDPPYNTGSDKIYTDNFEQNADEYTSNSGQIDEEGNRLVENFESSGRFHTKWLNMIYPRLRLAKDLLTNDGIIFISIDDNEIENLKKICNEIFGENKFVACFKWNRVAKAPSLSNAIRTKYEYVLAYCRNECPKLYGKASYNKQGPLWHLPNKRSELFFPAKSIRIKENFLAGVYGGTYQVELLDDMIEENGTNADDVRILACSAWAQGKIDAYIKTGNTFEIKKNPQTMYTDLDSENNYIAPSDLINDDECGVKRNTDAEADLRKMGIPFDYSKPVSLIVYLMKMVMHDDPKGIAMDFFSGSATTAEAIMRLNAEKGESRRFIMVQVREKTDEDSDARKAGFETICDIGEERIRKAGTLIAESISGQGKSIDIGFRCFKIDTTNMKNVNIKASKYTQIDMDNYISNIKDDRTSEDLLIQSMLDLGIELSSEINQITIEGKTVYLVANGFLVACFDQNVTDEVVIEIAKKKPFYAVFRDSSLRSDSVAVNFEQIFAAYSPDTTRKVI